MTRRNKSQRGSTLVEFTLVGIPLMFVLISIFEMARAMWTFTTVAHAVREGARYAVVHGLSCSTDPNQCATTRALVAGVIRDAGAGLIPDDFRVEFDSVTQNTALAVDPNVANWHTLSAQLASTAAFLNDDTGSTGHDVVVTGAFPFKSAMSMFWPGAGRMSFAVVNLAATARERIEF